jgi:thymidylate synthase
MDVATTRHQEYQYLELIQRILQEGSLEEGRNGNVYSVFGNMMRFSLKDGTWPLLTTKKVAWKTCFHELMWFLKGDTDNSHLQEKGVHIWDGNSTREFLDNRNLKFYPEGILGPIYGWQWRHWNADYIDWLRTNRIHNGTDQIQNLINDLRDPTKRTSRRLIVSAWNPEQLDEMALPPCHILMQFNVRDGKYLSCALYQRSGDVGLGVPFNIASYSMLTHLLANHCDLVADEFVYFLGNAHIYESHKEPLKEQLRRTPQYEFPKISIGCKRELIEDYTLEDIQWTTTYRSDPIIKMDMVA